MRICMPFFAPWQAAITADDWSSNILQLVPGSAGRNRQVARPEENWGLPVDLTGSKTLPLRESYRA